VADRLHDAQFHDLPGQQAQRPVGIAGRGWAQTGGDDLGLLLAIEQLRGRRVRPLDAVERLLEAAFDQPLADVLHRLPATTEGVDDLRVRPAGAVGVRLQKYLSAANLLAGALELLDDARELFPFLFRQTNHVLLAHRSLLAC
jgi:hypothetical protein